MTDDTSHGNAASTTTAPNAPAAASTALAVRPQREVRVVEDVAPLFDTARFEHYGRIAAVMATATLIPNALKGPSREETVGNCFMVVSMADRLGGFDPWAVAQCCSIIQGKLMLEAKLVHAAIKRKLGLDLFTHYTGTKGSDDFRVYVSDEPFTDDMIAALVPGMGLRGFRVIDGSVGEWKTFEKDGSIKGNWKGQPDLQLFYRGTRVWQRRFEPEIMLGVYTDDEMTDLEERAERVPRPKRDLKGKLDAAALAAPAPAEGQAADGGFDRQHVASETGEETMHAAEDAKAPEGDDAQDAEFAEVGHAKPGEVYLMADAPTLENGRRPIFKDGAVFSSKADVTGLTVYAEHPPEPASNEGAKSDERPTATASAPAADAGPASSETATNASADGAAETSSRQTSDASPGPAGSDDACPPHSWVVAEGTESCEVCGIDRAEIEEAEDEKPTGFLPSLRAMTTWAEIKAAFVAMNKTGEWIQAPDADKDEIRRMVWAEVERLRADHGAKVDQVDDISAFGLWMPTQSGRDGADAIEGTFNALKHSPAWAKINPTQQSVLQQRVEGKLQSIRGK